MPPALSRIQKFLVASVFPIAVVVIQAVSDADFTSTSGAITFAIAVLTALGVYAVPNKQPSE
jgi:hypothetical protein